MRARWGGIRVAAAIVLGVAAVAGAQVPATQTFTGPEGRFSISLPTTWSVALRRGGTPTLVGVAPGSPGRPGPSISVAVEALPRPMAPASYAALSGRMLQAMFRDYTLIQEGPATVGGQLAYYRYFTWHPSARVGLYQVQVYFTVGSLGFVVTGTTLNDPVHVRRDMPLIARIVETFRLAPPSVGSTS